MVSEETDRSVSLGFTPRRGRGRRYEPFDFAQGEPKWEEYPHTPGVFARVANKGDKSGQRTGMEVRQRRRECLEVERVLINNASSYHAEYYYYYTSIVVVKIELKENWK